MLPRKRKTAAKFIQSARKKAKREVSSLDDLPWRSSARPLKAGHEDDDGILELEEVEGVDVVYEETSTGRVVKFMLAAHAENKDSAEAGEPSQDDADFVDGSPSLRPVQESNAGPCRNTVEEEETEAKTFDANLLPEWATFSLHPVLLASIHRQKFLKPTPIQQKALPSGLSGKDVVGVAETGSGKTLAYGLPILQHVLNENRSMRSPRRLKALILTPTRELALQVSSHLKACVDEGVDGSAAEDVPSGKGKEKAKTSKAPRVSITAIVGGMSAQKQRRLLDKGIDVLIATPGRLWDILGADDDLTSQISQLRFLVLDEADRMIETGHFAELDNIVRLTLRQTSVEEADVQPPRDVDDEEHTSDEDEESLENTEGPPMQTFVFSATLSKELQINLKKRTKRISTKRRSDQTASTLDDLLAKLDFRDPEPAIIDLSPEKGVVTTLKESQVQCLNADKDVYLYYLLLRYPGRSLVFLSSIDGIRRLMPLMELLQLKAFPLHSQLQQRQRLKNLDRFKSIKNSILLATDVAARGLDIPSVDYVIHYQIPRSADVYIHRNGRTARAMRHGCSLLLCAPDEHKIVKGLMGSLNRTGKDEIPDMPTELDLLDKLKARVKLARRIDTEQHKISKEKHERNWLKEAADAMEIDLDSDFADDSDEAKPSKRSAKSSNVKISSMKAGLKQLLSKPLVARGISARYLTSGSRNIADEFIAQDGSGRGLLGFQQENDALFSPSIAAERA